MACGFQTQPKQKSGSQLSNSFSAPFSRLHHAPDITNQLASYARSNSPAHQIQFCQEGPSCPHNVCRQRFFHSCLATWSRQQLFQAYNATWRFMCSNFPFSEFLRLPPNYSILKIKSAQFSQIKCLISSQSIVISFVSQLPFADFY